MTAPLTGLTLLIVEDDWLVREDIANGFRQEGWTVLEASTGVRAVKLLQEAKTIDLLITDIRLGDATTGWDVAEALRELHPKAPGVYVSGARNNDRRAVPESIFLSKPVAVRQLMLSCSMLLLPGDSDGRAGIDMDSRGPTQIEPAIDIQRAPRAGR